MQQLNNSQIMVITFTMSLCDNSSSNSFKFVHFTFFYVDFKAFYVPLGPALDLDQAPIGPVGQVRIRHIAKDGHIPANYWDWNIYINIVLRFHDTNSGFTLIVDKLAHDVHSLDTKNELDLFKGVNHNCNYKQLKVGQKIRDCSIIT